MSKATTIAPNVAERTGYTSAGRRLMCCGGRHASAMAGPDPTRSVSSQTWPRLASYTLAGVLLGMLVTLNTPAQAAEHPECWKARILARTLLIAARGDRTRALQMAIDMGYTREEIVQAKAQCGIK